VTYVSGGFGRASTLKITETVSRRLVSRRHDAVVVRDHDRISALPPEYPGWVFEYQANELPAALIR
jgi:hypothetical protein